jgi:hypothetical protein
MTFFPRSLSRLSSRRRWILLAAVRAVIVAVVQVKFSSFRHLAAVLGRGGCESGFDLSAEQQLLARDVEWAIAAVSRRLSPMPTCLMQAAAAKRVLASRGVPATLYFGVAPDAGDGRAINAHAWLRCGTRIVTGRAQARRYRPLAWFA